MEGPFSPLMFISENLKNYTYYVDVDTYVCVFPSQTFTKDRNVRTKQQRLPLGLLLAEPTISHCFLGPLVIHTQDRELELGSRASSDLWVG